MKSRERCKDCKILKEQEKMIKQLEARLGKYENAHIPPFQKKFFNSPSLKPHKKPGGTIGYTGTTRPIPIPDETVEVKLKRCP